MPYDPSDNLRQYRHFPVRSFLQENDELLDAQWHTIPRTYEYDPVRGFKQRYTRIPERDGLFLFRSESRPSQYRKNADGSPKTLWRAEVRYVFGDEYDAMFAAINEWPDEIAPLELLAIDRAQTWSPENIAANFERRRDQE